MSQISGMALLRKQRGAQAAVARELGITRGAVAQWDRIPGDVVVSVEAATGIPREQLRPDLYRLPDAAA